MIVFIFAGPLGTLLGFVLNQEAPAVMAAIFMSLTAGTFL